jgi:hypothetical protein
LTLTNGPEGVKRGGKGRLKKPPRVEAYSFSNLQAIQASSAFGNEKNLHMPSMLRKTKILLLAIWLAL